MNGGQVALKGFAFQALMAALDSLAREDWVEMIIEPTSESDEYEKVDVLWRTNAGGVEHVQVKHSKNTFTLGKVKQWATEVRSRAASKHRLVLIGAAGEMPIEQTVEGVDVEVHPNDFDMILRACAHEISVLVEGSGRTVSASAAAAAARAVVANLLLGAKDGRRWTREALRAEIFACVPAPSFAPPVPAPTPTEAKVRATLLDTNGVIRRGAVELTTPLVFVHPTAGDITLTLPAGSGHARVNDIVADGVILGMEVSTLFEQYLAVKRLPPLQVRKHDLLIPWSAVVDVWEEKEYGRPRFFLELRSSIKCEGGRYRLTGRA